MNSTSVPPSFSILPSLQPSNSTSPTISSGPSASSFPSITPSTNTSQTESETDAPSMPPTDAWNIGRAAVIFGADMYPQMEVTHSIGSAVDSIRVTLLEYDCRQEVDETDSTYILNALTVKDSSKESGPKAKYTIEFSNLSSSSVIQGGSVQFCTKVELLTSNAFSVSFRKQRFSFNLSTIASFSNTLN